MNRVWAVLDRLTRRWTPARVFLVLMLWALVGGCSLALSVLMEGEPLSPLVMPPENDLQPVLFAEQPTPVETIELLDSSAEAPGSLDVSVAAPEPPDAPVDEPPLDGTAVPLPTELPVATNDLNILLLGTDRRSGRDPSWRTDTIIVVAIRPRSRRAAMFSIPRDLWVRIPGYGYNRINVVDYWGERKYGPGGGPRLLATTLQENFQIPIHAYVRIGFSGLERIIDALGGVTVTVARPFPDLKLAPGTQHMDGSTALAYARSRYHTNDMDRSSRQQQILLAIRDAALRPSILPQLPGLISALFDTVETDLSPGEVLTLARLAYQIDLASCRMQVFDGTMARDWITPGGAMVLLPNHARIQQVWAELAAP